MLAIISDVIKDSIAEELELEANDIILKINNKEVSDLIDFNFEILNEFLTLEVQKKDGSIEILEIEKDYNDQLGIIFESAVFDKIKLCQNHCIFCFVDQQPKGLRKTLYVKDDDYRLSYLQGTYITLTNLSEEDKKRIANLKLGPLYISVHTTNPELRSLMLNNKNAAFIMDQLDFLNKNDIPFHAQIVLCPKFNDSNELIRTLNDLYKFKKVLQSIAIVPLGLTKFKKQLNSDKIMQKIDENIANETISIVDNFNKKIKKNLAQVSDEFFIITNKPIPNKKYYGNFSQIEDGVGSIRLILDDFDKRKKSLPLSLNNTTKNLYIIFTKASYYAFKDIIKTLNKIDGLNIKPLVIKSNFWGEDVTVSGLLTGKDILDYFNENFKDTQDIKDIILPSIMLKPFSKTFLDDLTINDLESKLNCNVHIINDIYSTKELLDLCLN